MSPINLPAVVVPSSGSPAASAPAHATAPGVKPEVARAAREFEAIFLRQILTSLEKTGHMGSTGSTGSDVYGSMMVGALADAVAGAGGVGLAKYVTTSLVHAPSAAPRATPSATSPGSLVPSAPAGFPISTSSPAAGLPISTGSPASTALIKGAGMPLQPPKPIAIQPPSKTSQKGIP
jgi:flagellar protein FlgJ